MSAVLNDTKTGYKIMADILATYAGIRIRALRRGPLLCRFHGCRGVHSVKGPVEGQRGFIFVLIILKEVVKL